MTVFSGILTTSSGYDRENDLAAIIQSGSVGPHDVLHRWNDPSLSLVQATYHVTPESQNELLPLYNREAGLVIAGNIRLDNRDELFAKLAIPHAVRQVTGDAELVLAAYRKWQDNCMHHLLGDYIFAIWDTQKRQLFCCNDHIGNRTLFYYADGQKIIFSSDIQAIKTIPGIKTSPNYNRLAKLVDSDLYRLEQEESWFTNIYQLLPATVLTADAHGVKTHRYWRPALGEELKFKDEGEYREAFQEIFFETVSCRLRSGFPVTALLSGGLDSSSVVSVAAKILEKQNKELNVFSAVLPDENDPVFKDERYYIDMFKSFHNVSIHYSAPPDKGFLSHMDKLNNLSSPGISSRHYLYQDFFEKAERLNSRVILDGMLGELSATNYGDGFYAGLFSKFRWRLLWKELNARKMLVGDGLTTQIRSQVIKPFVPDFLTALYRERDKVDININGYIFFQPAFADMLKQRAAALKNNKGIGIFNVQPNQRANQLANFKGRHDKGSETPILGLAEFRYPFADKRLMEFCLNAPSTLKVRNGYKRSMVRIGLDGILPPEIQWRNTKCPFSPDYMRRYNAQLGQAREFFNNIKSNDPVRELIDVEKMKLYANLPVADNETDKFKQQQAMHNLPKAIYTICFLRQFKEFRL
jgi:asparagine synthase (glutamine-hydrolysing)